MDLAKEWSTIYDSRTRGALWAATESGLSRILDGRIQTLTSKNGLPCDQVHWSIEDDDHFVWIYTSCGFGAHCAVRAGGMGRDPARIIKITIFDTSDGITSHSTAGGYSPRVAQVRGWKIVVRALGRRECHRSAHLPSTKFRRRYTSSKSPRTANLLAKLVRRCVPSPPRLPPQVRDLTIDYTALSLVIPEKVLFRYKLEGWDHDWQDADHSAASVLYESFSTQVPIPGDGVQQQRGVERDRSVTGFFHCSGVLPDLVVPFDACGRVFGGALGLYQLRLQQLAREFNMRLTSA